MLPFPSINQNLWVDFSSDRTWWNCFSAMGNSHACHLRIHWFIIEISDFESHQSLHRLCEAYSFTLSLLGKTMNWLKGEPSKSITIWYDLAKMFIIQFFPSVKTGRLRSKILSFKQNTDNNFYHPWERFKTLIRNCLQHQQTNDILAYTFFEELDHNKKFLLDQLQVVRLWRKYMMRFIPC